MYARPGKRQLAEAAFLRKASFKPQTNFQLGDTYRKKCFRQDPFCFTASLPDIYHLKSRLGYEESERYRFPINNLSTNSPELHKKNAVVQKHVRPGQSQLVEAASCLHSQISTFCTKHYFTDSQSVRVVILQITPCNRNGTFSAGRVITRKAELEGFPAGRVILLQ
jgi:hypothetical protein